MCVLQLYYNSNSLSITLFSKINKREIKNLTIRLFVRLARGKCVCRCVCVCLCGCGTDHIRSKFESDKKDQQQQQQQRDTL